MNTSSIACVVLAPLLGCFVGVPEPAPPRKAARNTTEPTVVLRTSIPEQFRYGDPALVRLGATLYVESCSSCHSLDGSEQIAPSLLGVFQRARTNTTRFTSRETSRSVIGSGKRYRTAGHYIADQILQPDSLIVDGYAALMPIFDGTLAEDELEALVVFLARLDPSET